MEADNDIERQIKELEGDKRLEEIKQLRAAAKRAGSRPPCWSLCCQCSAP
jgi:hypothetical protein